MDVTIVKLTEPESLENSHKVTINHVVEKSGDCKHYVRDATVESEPDFIKKLFTDCPDITHVLTTYNSVIIQCDELDWDIIQHRALRILLGHFEPGGRIHDASNPFRRSKTSLICVPEKGLTLVHKPSDD